MSDVKRQIPLISEILAYFHALNHNSYSNVPKKPIDDQRNLKEFSQAKTKVFGIKLSHLSKTPDIGANNWTYVY